MISACLKHTLSLHLSPCPARAAISRGNSLLLPARPHLSTSPRPGTPAALKRKVPGSTRLAASATSASAAMAALFEPTAISVDRIPMFNDNYCWLLHEPKEDVRAVVDPGEPGPILQALKERGIKVDFIINTHHHMDHVGGNSEIKSKGGDSVKIVGNGGDARRIPGIDIKVSDGDTWKFGAQEVQVIETPGHTVGHVCYYMPNADCVFTGDTLFAMGCGRLFEGSPEQMWNSLSKLKVLPPSTGIYCAHEYTAANAKFALSVDGGNKALQERAEDVGRARAQGVATVPSRMDVELATNPFLRPDDAGVRAGVGLGSAASDVEVFTAVRKAKDSF